MKKLIAFSSLFVLALCAAQSARADACNGYSAALNLVSNCGFESGTFSGWSGTAVTLGVPGNYAGVDSGDIGYAPPTPFSGTYEAYIGPPSQTTYSLTQSLTTVVGGQYTVQFALLSDTSPSTGYTNSFTALFGTNTIFSESAVAAGSYMLYTAVTTATSSSTNLSFNIRNDGGYFELDSVSVVATPEPSSILLLGTGILSVAGMARRRLLA